MRLERIVGLDRVEEEGKGPFLKGNEVKLGKEKEREREKDLKRDTRKHTNYYCREESVNEVEGGIRKNLQWSFVYKVVLGKEVQMRTLILLSLSVQVS